MDPMLAQLARELPAGAFFYEPKWDGFRCLASVQRGRAELYSRHGRPFARYFPEIVEALGGLPDCVADGELLAEGGFGALLNRVHPSRSRVEELRRTTPASYVLFDVLELRGNDVTARPFEERRALLESLELKPPLFATPITEDAAVAQKWMRQSGSIDGVIAKARGSPYVPGKRGWIKVKPQHTVDCVVAGFRALVDDRAVASLLLGLYRGDDLVHVGVSSQFRAAQRRALFDELLPLATRLEGHPWQNGFNLGRSPMGRLPGSAGRWVPGDMTQDWVPLEPLRVCEVAYDKLDVDRMRHPARFLRWRPDREPRSCTFAQLPC